MVVLFRQAVTNRVCSVEWGKVVVKRIVVVSSGLYKKAHVLSRALFAISHANP